jgi:hypothetical protein
MLTGSADPQQMVSKGLEVLGGKGTKKKKGQDLTMSLCLFMVEI